MLKEKELSLQKKETRSLSAVTGELKTNISCCWWKATCPFYAARWLTFPRVANVFVTSNPRLKTHKKKWTNQTTTKNPEFGYINPRNDK